MIEYLLFIIILAIILYGGFYSFSILLIGVFLEIAVLIKMHMKKAESQDEDRPLPVIPIALLFLQILISFWAIDCIWNITEIMLFADVVMWMYLCKDLNSTEKVKILDAVPVWGAITVVVAGVAYFIPALRGIFWQADRLGGTFQYPNTYALLLLLGLGIVVDDILNGDAPAPVKKTKKRSGSKSIKGEPVRLSLQINELVLWQKLAIVILLGLGILLTGCRSILLLAIVYGVYKAVMNKKLRVPVVSFFGAVIVISGVSAFIPGMTQNLGRLFTIFKYNSTLWGRLLYYKDALQMILRHPFGLGYMGYYYIQGSEQTGVYTTRFVHNDLLQLGLDSGIAALILAVVFLVLQFVKGKQKKEYKELLALIILASFVDWHCQFPAILLIGVLFLDLDGNLKIELSKISVKKIATVVMVILIPISLYLSLAQYMGTKGNTTTALALLPGNTEVLESTMTKISDKDKAVYMANKVLSHNRYSDISYNTLAYAAAVDADVDAVIENGDRVLALKRYDVNYYEKYLALLQDLLQNCSEADRDKIISHMEEIPKELAALKDITSELAYKTRDIPVFEIQN